MLNHHSGLKKKKALPKLAPLSSRESQLPPLIIDPFLAARQSDKALPQLRALCHIPRKPPGSAPTGLARSPVPSLATPIECIGKPAPAVERLRVPPLTGKLRISKKGRGGFLNSSRMALRKSPNPSPRIKSDRVERSHAFPEFQSLTSQDDPNNVSFGYISEEDIPNIFRMT